MQTEPELPRIYVNAFEAPLSADFQHFKDEYRSKIERTVGQRTARSSRR